jgi:hypothetical protein
MKPLSFLLAREDPFLPNAGQGRAPGLCNLTLRRLAGHLLL